MKRILTMCMLSIFVLSACEDNIDITRYPGYVQNCYHDIVDNKNNCTTSKRKIIKYCECCYEMEPLIAKKSADLDTARYQVRSQLVSLGGLGLLTGALTMPEFNQGLIEELRNYTQKLYDNCAKDTGYTRIANCPKK